MAATKVVEKQLLKLPNPTTVVTSVLFLKKLTGAAISHIVYARNMFHEKDFHDKTFEGMPIKVIKGLSDNGEGAFFLTKWLEGAFHALERKYLKSLELEINEQLDGGGRRLLETYSFQYEYSTANEVQCTLRGSDGESVNLPNELSGERRETVRNMIRNILVMTSTCQPLPQNCVTCVRLSYYDEVTPVDYEPPNFKAFEGSPSQFDEKIVKYNCGSVNTPFHLMCVRIKALKQISSKEQGKKVECLCKLKDISVAMLICDECSTLQHPPCFKMIGEDKSQLSHSCFKCSDTAITKDFEPDECIFRRILKACAKSKSVSITSLMRVVSLKAGEIILYMRRLQREGALPKAIAEPFSVANPDLAYKINETHVKALSKKYFTT